MGTAAVMGAGVGADGHGWSVITDGHTDPPIDVALLWDEGALLLDAAQEAVAARQAGLVVGPPLDQAALAQALAVGRATRTGLTWHRGA